MLLWYDRCGCDRKGIEGNKSRVCFRWEHTLKLFFDKNFLKKQKNYIIMIHIGTSRKEVIP